jgi:hypothetical protein
LLRLRYARKYSEFVQKSGRETYCGIHQKRRNALFFKCIKTPYNPFLKNYYPKPVFGIKNNSRPNIISYNFSILTTNLKFDDYHKNEEVCNHYKINYKVKEDSNLNPQNFMLCQTFYTHSSFGFFFDLIKILFRGLIIRVGSFTILSKLISPDP